MQPKMTKARDWRRDLAYFCTALVLVLCWNESFALSPSEAFDKGRAKLISAKTLTASFTFKGTGQMINGKLVSKGKKFALITGTTSSWYNGSDLYTYDHSANETYVFKPTASDLREINPLLYLSSSSDYKVTGTKTKKNGVETIVLIPKKPGGSVKSVTVDLDSKTFLPKSIHIKTSSGQSVLISISDINLNTSVGDSVFEYPKGKYPKAKINDMR